MKWKQKLGSLIRSTRTQCQVTFYRGSSFQLKNKQTALTDCIIQNTQVTTLRRLVLLWRYSFVFLEGIVEMFPDALMQTCIYLKAVKWWILGGRSYHWGEKRRKTFSSEHHWTRRGCGHHAANIRSRREGTCWEWGVSLCSISPTVHGLDSTDSPL